MHFQILLGLLYACVTYALVSQEVYTFPVNMPLESLSLRTNGQILITVLSRPEVYLVDTMSNNNTTMLYTNPAYASAVGLTMVEEDHFYVILGNFSTTTGVSTPGSYSVFHIDMTGYNATQTPIVEKVTDIPEGGLLNGMGLISEEDGLVYVTDSIGGVIYILNVYTGEYSEGIVNDLTIQLPDAPTPAVNAVKYRDGITYWTNTAQGIMARIAVNADGTVAGEPEIVLSGLTMDDFALDGEGGAIVAVYGSDEVARIDLESGEYIILAGGANTTELETPSAVQFGRTERDSNSVYVTRNGGVGRPTVVGGGLRRIDL